LALESAEVSSFYVVGESNAYLAFLPEGGPDAQDVSSHPEWFPYRALCATDGTLTPVWSLLVVAC